MHEVKYYDENGKLLAKASVTIRPVRGDFVCLVKHAAGERTETWYHVLKCWSTTVITRSIEAKGPNSNGSFLTAWLKETANPGEAHEA
jgi:hypothetical protein